MMYNFNYISIILCASLIAAEVRNRCEIITYQLLYLTFAEIAKISSHPPGFIIDTREFVNSRIVTTLSVLK